MESRKLFLIIILLLVVLQVYALLKIILIKQTNIGKDYENFIEKYNTTVVPFKYYSKALKVWDSEFSKSKNIEFYGYYKNQWSTGYQNFVLWHGYLNNVSFYERALVHSVGASAREGTLLKLNNTSYVCVDNSFDLSKCKRTDKYSYVFTVGKYIKPLFIFTYFESIVEGKYKKYPNGTIVLKPKTKGGYSLTIYIERNLIVYKINGYNDEMMLFLKKSSNSPEQAQKLYIKSHRIAYVTHEPNTSIIFDPSTFFFKLFVQTYNHNTTVPVYKINLTNLDMEENL